MASRHLTIKNLLLLTNWLRENVELLKTEYAPAVAKAAEAALGFPISDRSIHSIAEAEGFVLRRHIEIEQAAAKTKPEPQLFDGDGGEQLDHLDHLESLTVRLERLIVRLERHLNLQTLIVERHFDRERLNRERLHLERQRNRERLRQEREKLRIERQRNREQIIKETNQ